ncbi:hypothetical protein ACFVS2_26225 [Brevibacillus sp. NPDC058079]|uniref:hypothetical protein n=1 Tax=Brevibacillus sp. NPDC058079 TaxID=3346330 RepID=UPI0036E97B18
MPKLGLLKRLHQLVCPHKHQTKIFIGYGINDAEGKEIFAYDCIYCGHALFAWEDKKDEDTQ